VTTAASMEETARALEAEVGDFKLVKSFQSLRWAKWGLVTNIACLSRVF
jgi:hypothetical protein